MSRSRWDDKPTTDKEAFEDIYVNVLEIVGEEAPGGLRSWKGVGKVDEVLRKLRGWIPWLEERVEADRGRNPRYLWAKCAGVGLIVEEPCAVGLAWLVGRRHDELALWMADLLLAEGARAEVRVEPYPLASFWKSGGRAGVVEHVFKHTLFVADPEEGSEPIEVWLWYRSIACGDHNYREGGHCFGEWSEEVSPGWWNWENNSPTDNYEAFREHEASLLTHLGIKDAWPPEERITKEQAEGESK